MVEMLCCVIIMLLVSIGMVNGVSLAVRSYQKSVMTSESQVLCNTLTSLVSDELRYSGTTYWTENPIAFYSRNYGDKCVFSTNDDGQVTLGGNKLLPSKAYHFGMRAEVTLTKKENTENTFSVKIEVKDAGGKLLAENSFDAEKLNTQEAAE